MILEKKKKKKSKEFQNKLLEAQKQGKINKQLRKANKKRKLAEKRKLKLIGEKKKRKCTKSSQIHDYNGIVLGHKLDKGTKHDSKIFLEHLNEKMFIKDKLNDKLNDKYKKYMLADSDHDSELLKEKLRKLGYVDVIYPNKRNNKIKLILNDNEKVIPCPRTN